jgi:hypothetical protein
MTLVEKTGANCSESWTEVAPQLLVVDNNSRCPFGYGGNRLEDLAKVGRYFIESTVIPVWVPLLVFQKRSKRLFRTANLVEQKYIVALAEALYVFEE